MSLPVAVEPLDEMHLKILCMETSIRKNLVPFTFPLLHIFLDGCYHRAMFIPAGYVVTGKRHRTAHWNTVIGDISVSTDSGLQRITGYHKIHSNGGKKRVGFAHADTIWINHHETAETDLQLLEKQLTYPEPSPELVDNFVNTLLASNALMEFSPPDLPAPVCRLSPT